MTDTFPDAVSPADLAALLAGPAEFALIDVREKGQFGLRHLLHAVNLPYSELEPGITQQVPLRHTRIVLIDANDGIAALAARRLRALGYTSVGILVGGVDAWEAAGGEIFLGEDVLSKAFGELVELRHHTPAIDPAELRAMLDAGRKVVILDGRAPDEHSAASIPGSISVPNGELVLRAGEWLDDPDTTFVVTCAGRTRSIIGTQTLASAGLARPVYALRGGTQSWRIAGLPLERGSQRSYAGTHPAALAHARTLAGALASQEPPHLLSRDTLEQLQAEGRRTLYLLDVRDAAAFAQGHLPGAQHTPGGQLVHRVMRTCSVLNAILVLLDDAPLARAISASFWLRQMGFDARILENGLAGLALVDTASVAQAPVPADVATINAAELAHRRSQEELTLIDASPAMSYRAAHIPGARWYIRPRLRQQLAALSEGDAAIVVYADTPDRARLAAGDLAELLPDRDVRVLAGGLAAWQALDLATDASPDQPSDDESIDYLFWAHDRHLGNDAATQAYFDWELGLPAQIERDGSARFQFVHPT